jgi:hypothetical protein
LSTNELPHLFESSLSRDPSPIFTLVEWLLPVDTDKEPSLLFTELNSASILDEMNPPPIGLSHSISHLSLR